jgi:hypothetical protein
MIQAPNQNNAFLCRIGEACSPLNTLYYYYYTSTWYSEYMYLLLCDSPKAPVPVQLWYSETSASSSKNGR